MDEPAPIQSRTFERPRPMGIDIPMGRTPAEIRRRMEAMEKLLERSLTIPGTKIGVGLDSIIGLVPVVGDAIAAGITAFQRFMGNVRRD